jgi:hypothetical protein
MQAHDWVFVMLHRPDKTGSHRAVAHIPQGNGGIAAQHPYLGTSNGSSSKGGKILVVGYVQQFKQVDIHFRSVAREIVVTERARRLAGVLGRTQSCARFCTCDLI